MDYDEKRTALEEQVAEALRRHPDKTHTIYEQAGAVLDALAVWFTEWNGRLPDGGVVQRHERRTTARILSDPTYLAASGRVTEGKGTP